MSSIDVVLFREMFYLFLHEVYDRSPSKIQGKDGSLRHRARRKDERTIIYRVPGVNGVFRVEDYRTKVLVEDLEIIADFPYKNSVCILGYVQYLPSRAAAPAAMGHARSKRASEGLIAGVPRESVTWLYAPDDSSLERGTRGALVNAIQSWY